MASLRLLLFYIYFRSLLIKTRLIFISYFVSVPLRKGHRGSEYKCSFVRLYLFLFAFLIICIETFGFHRLFCNKGMCDLTNTIKSPIQYIRTDYTDIETDYWEKIHLILFLLCTKYQYFNLPFYLNHEIYC